MIKTYLITLVTFFAIDMVWLGIVAKNLYQSQIGHLLADKPNWAAAIVFYLLFIAGLVYFIIDPALKAESWQQALFRGMLFGFITYATYDLTNLATLKAWPVKITIIDLIWGTALGGSVSLISYKVIQWLK